MTAPARLMRQDDAAAYCGMSRNTFRAYVECKTFPEPILRNGRLVLWDRRQLDDAIDRLTGVISDPFGWDDA